MGRPYANEMALLPETYEWALGAEIDEFTAGIRSAAAYPLVAVGSGGSLTAAHFTADLHQRYFRQVARVMTPYEVVAFGGPPPGAAVIMFSAGGKNADIRGALDACLAAEPSVLVLVTGAKDNPAARTARAAQYPRVIALDIPSGRDGFLATNSLLAFAALTARAYSSVNGAADEIPSTWGALTGENKLPEAALIGASRTLVTLHGLDTRAAAVDLESKCTEAALASVQLADYRNFAHGRHHWLAKHDTTVLTLESPSDRHLVDRTLALLPRGQRVARLQTRHSGVAGSLEALVRVMQLAGALGQVVGIDPGRPGVPDFGGKLYSLRVIEHAAPQPTEPLSELERIALRRKTRRDPDVLARSGTLPMWRAEFAVARKALEQTKFGAIVFDYDGTLVDGADRFRGPRPEVVGALEAILLAGIPVGIATGRGRSGGTELRNRLAKELWERVLVGYYNGGDIAPLTDCDAPDGKEEVCKALQPAFAALSTHSLLNEMALVTPRLPQITVEPCDARFADDVWRLVSSALVGEPGRSVRVVRSSHSIDVLPNKVSKGQVVHALRRRFDIGETCAILAVGDCGQWPGNDAEMLATLEAVSVDQASAAPAHAWQWAPLGARGVAATLALCERLVMAGSDSTSAEHSTFRVTLEGPVDSAKVGAAAQRQRRRRKGEP